MPKIDLESIQDLVRAADIEGHIAEGAPADEYEPEEEAIFDALKDIPADEMTTPYLTVLLETIWTRSFSLDTAALSQRQPAIEALAAQIVHFFGINA